MKKYILPFLAALFLISCADEVTLNQPSIQARTNLGYYFTTHVKAHLNDDGSLTIKGEEGARTLNLTIDNPAQGVVFNFGDSLGSNVATFTTTDSLVYSTLNQGDGSIVIDSMNELTITGTFYFNAPPEQGFGDAVNFNHGAFFRVPLGSGLSGDQGTPPDSTACLNAMQNAQMAANDYSDAQQNGDSTTIQQACLTYQQALQDEIQACGDESGDLQALLDSLNCN